MLKKNPISVKKVSANQMKWGKSRASRKFPNPHPRSIFYWSVINVQKGCSHQQNPYFALRMIVGVAYSMEVKHRKF